MTGLPTGWRWETVADAARGGLFCDGDWVESKDQDPLGSVRLTQLADVGVGVFRDRSDRWMRDDQASALACTYLRPADILVARMPEPLARACLVPKNIGPAVTAVDVAVIRPTRVDIEPRFLMWFFNAPQGHSQAVALQSGTTRKRISRKNLARLRMPIPPLHEQRRIVDILEDHFSRLDAARVSLVAASRRADVLAGAVLEASSAGAHLRPLSEIAEVQGGIQKQARREPNENPFPFLRVANVTAHGLDTRDVHQVELFGREIDRYRLEKGDLLVVEGNGSPSQVGRAALWDGSIQDCVHQNHLIRVRAVGDLLPGFLEVVWNAPSNRRRLTAVASSTSGLHTLSVRKLEALRLPVPSPEEQARVVAEVTERRAALGRLLAAVDLALERESGLRRALLAAAFSGRLTGRSSDLDLAEELAAQ